jgi:hypothetical protein
VEVAQSTLEIRLGLADTFFPKSHPFISTTRNEIVEQQVLHGPDLAVGLLSAGSLQIETFEGSRSRLGQTRTIIGI